MGSQPMVLIARLDDGRTLCAVEREGRGKSVLCQLGSWVTLQQLKNEAVVSRQEVERGWNLTKIDLDGPPIVPEAVKYSSKKRLEIEAIQSMVKLPSSSLVGDSQAHVGESQATLVDSDSIIASQCDGNTIEPTLDDPAPQPTAAEIFENVRNQYFEALYISKVRIIGPLVSNLTDFPGFTGIFCKRTFITSSCSISSGL
jgi:DNA replication regulator SLD3